MKKIVLMFVLILFTGILSAKSDIQLTLPLLSFFNKTMISAEDYTINNNNLFAIFDSNLRLLNQNYIRDNKIGFYESVTISTPTIDEINSFWGIKIALGPSVKMLESNYVNLNACLGPDIQIFEKGIIIGSEIDIQAKFTPKRRCSPIVGAICNIDFYSSLPIYESVIKEKAGEYRYENQIYLYTDWYIEYEKHKTQKYFHFYLQPYIAFCINLY